MENSGTGRSRNENGKQAKRRKVDGPTSRSRQAEPDPLPQPKQSVRPNNLEVAIPSVDMEGYRKYPKGSDQWKRGLFEEHIGAKNRAARSQKIDLEEPFADLATICFGFSLATLPQNTGVLPSDESEPEDDKNEDQETEAEIGRNRGSESPAMDILSSQEQGDNEIEMDRSCELGSPRSPTQDISAYSEKENDPDLRRKNKKELLKIFDCLNPSFEERARSIPEPANRTNRALASNSSPESSPIKERLYTANRKHALKLKRPNNIESTISHYGTRSGINRHTKATGPATLPELTTEMLQLIKHSIEMPPDTSIHPKPMFGIDLKVKDIRNFDNRSWLADNDINFYLELIRARNNATESNMPSVFILRAEVITLYLQNNFQYRGIIDGASDPHEIFDYELLFFPIHANHHWTLVHVNVKEKSVVSYDSYGHDRIVYQAGIQKYLVKEYRKLQKRELERDGENKKYSLSFKEYFENWTMKNSYEKTPTPKQSNGSDCGPFILQYAEYLSRGQPFDFDQSHMTYFRQRMVLEILEGKLFTADSNSSQSSSQSPSDSSHSSDP